MYINRKCSIGKIKTKKKDHHSIHSTFDQRLSNFGEYSFYFAL